MTRRRDPRCPVEGSPCLLALDDLLIEFAKIKAREDGRSLAPCRTCGERNKIPLAGLTRCYACRVHPIEGDHVAGSGSGPAVIRGSANVNRITAEGERVL